jgi:putative sigma-54 modulation protein
VIYERNHGGYGVIQPRNANGHTHHKNGKTAHNVELTVEKLNSF